MYIERVPNRNSPPAVLLREGWREDGKIKKRTVANLSHLPDHIIENLRAALKNEVVPAAQAIVDPEQALVLHDARPHGHVAAVLGTLRRIGLERMIDRRACRERDVAVAMIVDRLLCGDSKLATARHCHADTATSSLGSILDLDDLSEKECYAAMDWLLERQPAIQKRLAAQHLDPGGMVLFDLTSSYFEGHACPLAAHGYSRDHRRDRPQVVYGMYCNALGVPIGVDVFPGNTNDHRAFPQAVERARSDFGIDQVVFVGDRGMISGKAIDNLLRDSDGAGWITALTNSAIASLERQGAIQTTWFDEQDLIAITHPDHPEERLVVCRNPLLADERRRKREELLIETEKKLAAVQQRVRRDYRPLRGQDAIGVAIGKVIDTKKMAKHFDTCITDDDVTFERNQQRIDKEATLDGLYIIRTSVPEQQMSAEDIVANYKNLARVERAFQSLKSINISVRPIYHHLEERVRAHIFLCMLAYYVEYAMRRALAPILFHDEIVDRDRLSVVQPARRSAEAQAKDSTKKTSDGCPVSSFRDVIAGLQAITKTRVTIRNHPAQGFTKMSTPSPYQNTIIELLGVQRHL